MASTIKVTNIDTPDGSGNITVDRPLSGSGASLTSLPAANLTGTLPAISGANLTNLNGSNIASGTVADARISALTASKLTGALPAIDGSNLTGISGGFEVGARGYSAVVQTFATATRTIVELEAESYDLNNDFNTTTDRYVAPTTGEYLVVGGCKLGSVTDAKQYQVELQINGSLKTYTVSHGSHTANINHMVSDIFQLSASDYVQMSIYQNSGSNKSTDAGEFNVFLAVHRLS